MHGRGPPSGGTMLFLFILGDTVEKACGHLRYLGFYLIAGLVAALAQVYSGPESILPSLGASGAIAGVLAAYVVMFPPTKARVLLGSFTLNLPSTFLSALSPFLHSPPPF